jgi:enterochelin esterase family protein
MTEVPYVRHAIDLSRPVRYEHGPDSFPQPGVPRGTIVEEAWTTSRVFPGTSHRYWVYVPAQYDAARPASLMVFQDGALNIDPDDEMRVLGAWGGPAPPRFVEV